MGTYLLSEYLGTYYTDTLSYYITSEASSSLTILSAVVQMGGLVLALAVFSWSRILLTNGILCLRARNVATPAAIGSIMGRKVRNPPSCSSGSKYYLEPLSTGTELKMAGFGKRSDPSLKKHIIDGNSMCPCGSNAIYGECCGPFHSLEAFARDPVPMTRARFSAFSMANADYIIDTTYYKHKDYKRYLENSALDAKKSKAKWKKEITTLNCDQFEFLKCDILSEPVIDDRVIEAMKRYPHSSEDLLITFNVLVRQKSSQEFVSFQETSIYTNEEDDSDKNQVFKRSDQNIFYCEAIVKALDKEDNEKLVVGVGYQRSSIKDQW